MKYNDMMDIVWTTEMEIDLLYAMMDHKPVGQNKHFHMIFIYEKYNNLNEKKLTVDQIWDHLKSMYDLNSLNENDVAPFPVDQIDFSLSSFSDFGPLLKDKSCSSSPELEADKPATRRKSMIASDKYDFDNQTNYSSNDESCTNGSAKKSSNDGENSINSDDVDSVNSSAKLTPTSTQTKLPKQARQRASSKYNEERKMGNNKKRKN